MLVLSLAFTALKKSTGVEHTVPPGGWPPNSAFVMLAQLCTPEAKAWEADALWSTKNAKGGIKT